MAVCPNCNRKLHFWNVKAECPDCGANIPNYNWEERLEEDAQAREAAFFKLYTTLNRLKFAVVGNTLRIFRLVFSFLPIVAYIVPFASLSITPTNGKEVKLGGLGLVSLFTGDLKLSTFTELLSNAQSKQVGISGLIWLGVLAMSLLIGVVTFFLIPILNKKPRSAVYAILHAASLVLYSVSPIMLSRFVAAYNTANLGQASGSASWGLFVGIGLFAIAVIIDILVAIKPLEENDGKYIPKDELQIEYAKSIGAI